MTLADPNLGFKVMVLFKGEYYSELHIAQLRTIL